MFALAQTAWPRFGGDQGNRSQSTLSGPHSTPTWHKVTLPTSTSTRELDRTGISGVIVMPDETLRLCHMGMLSAVTLDGQLLWQIDLAEIIPENRHYYYSLPTALQTGETLVMLPHGLLIVDGQGNIQPIERDTTSTDAEGNLEQLEALDDTGYSPNLTYDGHLILSAMIGNVYVTQEPPWHEVGVFGYDIVTPAVYPDNSLAIAGYAHRGFCRVNLDGQTQWNTRTNTYYADMLPTINRDQIAAVGSANDHRSFFFAPDGTQVGEYHQAATFAEYSDGGWIALSRRGLARLTSDGKEIWSQAISRDEGFIFVEQPIVDREGFVFVGQAEGYACYDPAGQIVFEHILADADETQGPLSIIAPQTLAHVQENTLYIGHS